MGRGPCALHYRSPDSAGRKRRDCSRRAFPGVGDRKVVGCPAGRQTARLRSPQTAPPLSAGVLSPSSPRVPGLLRRGPGVGARPPLGLARGLRGAQAARRTDREPGPGASASRLPRSLSSGGKQQSIEGGGPRREGVSGRGPLGQRAQTQGVPGEGPGRAAPHVGRAAQPHEQAGRAAHRVVAGARHVLVPGAGGRGQQQQKPQ